MKRNNEQRTRPHFWPGEEREAVLEAGGVVLQQEFGQLLQEGVILQRGVDADRRRRREEYRARLMQERDRLVQEIAQIEQRQRVLEREENWRSFREAMHHAIQMVTETVDSSI